MIYVLVLHCDLLTGSPGLPLSSPESTNMQKFTATSFTEKCEFCWIIRNMFVSQRTAEYKIWRLANMQNLTGDIFLFFKIAASVLSLFHLPPIPTK